VLLSETASQSPIATTVLTAHLQAVERRLHAAVRCDSPELEEIVGHLVTAGGKRLRPQLVAAAASAVSGMLVIDPRVVSASVAVELLHIGSLHHDDVMDGAPSRRGVESVNQRWGNAVAILAGDVLLSRASRTALALGTLEAQVLSDALEAVCAGQAAEWFTLSDPERPVEAYLAAIGDKTASLMAAACHLGALEAGGTSDEIAALRHFGQRFGMAFQILDDLHDLGPDLRQGVYTLPVILGVEADPQLGEWLGRPLADPELERAMSAFRSSSGFTRSIALVAEDLAAARCLLEDLPEAPNVGIKLLDDIATTVAQELTTLSAEKVRC
jgi:heptaprenyl diphosphate synthase